MYFILIFLLIITIITITVYLFAKSSSVTKSSSVCKDNQKFLNNSCCDLTRIYTDKDNIEKCCQKDVCNKMCCGDDQICDPKQGCQNTYDCNGYDCIVTKGGKYTEPTCGSKCPKRPTPSSRSSGSNIGTTIGIVVVLLVLCLIGGYFMYNKIFKGTTLQSIELGDRKITPLHESSRSDQIRLN